MAERRAACAMVRFVGGDTARLEMPAPPIAGDDEEQLGLRTPEFFAKLLAPVAIRSAKDSTEVLVAADVLEELLGVSGCGAVAAAMMAVYAVVIGDVRYRMTTTECVKAKGDACLYRLLLTANGVEVV
ncbi:hypothetical protein [Terriglobus sp. RCC_193]|uniref:hypothetical protein n=1 Tax=Terriglobus sp. RCC_193 TaxID=3239218 RepID=UPI003525A04D